MGLKRISIALLTAAILSIIYAASGLEKQEMLRLDSSSSSIVITKYSFKGLNILTGRQGRSALGAHIIGVASDKLELIGTLASKTGKFAVVAYGNGINLYTADGKLKARYEAGSAKGEIISCCISDIDGDSNEELLAIEGDGKTFYGNKLVMLSYDSVLKKFYEREFQELNPWKVQSCDVDGDNRREIALGVYKEANFNPVMAKRPFLYHWDNGDITPMWRGSRLSRPFDDYIFYDIDSDKKDEIIAIERLQDGKVLINSYKWAGFGFESIAESRPYEDIMKLVTQNDGEKSLLVQIREGKRKSWIGLEKVDEQLVEQAEFDNTVYIKK